MTIVIEKNFLSTDENKAFDSVNELILSSGISGKMYLKSYYDGWQNTLDGPMGGHYAHTTGATNTAPTIGSPVPMSTIGTGAQAGYYWDRDGKEWVISGDQQIDVSMFGGFLNGVDDDLLAFQALANWGVDVIWRGAALVSGPVLITTSGQKIHGLDESASITASDSTQRVIFAVVNGAKNVRFDGFIIIGKNTTEVAIPSGASLGAIAINTNAAGTDHSGIAQTGANTQIDNVIFSGDTATSGFNVCINNNLSEGLTVTNCQMTHIVGLNDGYGYGVTASGDKQRYINNNCTPINNSNGRHAIYANGGPNDVWMERNYAANFQSQAFLSKSNGAGTCNNVYFIDNTAIDCCRAGTARAASIGHYETGSTGLANQGDNIYFLFNTIQTSGQHGLYALEATNVVAKGNQIHDVAHHGVWFDTVEQGEFVGGIIENIPVGFVGMELQSCIDLDVINVRIQSNTAYRSGIRFNAGAPQTDNCRVITPKIDSNWTTADIENDDQNNNQVIRFQNNNNTPNVGDTDLVLTLSDNKFQRYGTALTANRTVTLPTPAYEGAEFYIVRNAGGAFTLDVGGLKTIPASTLATVHVNYMGGAWRLVGYSLL